MNITRLVVISGLAISLLLSTWSFAGDGHGKSAIYQLAEIMHRLKHYPSPQGKRELQMIVQAKSTTNNERIIAKAMMNLEHEPAAEDIPFLKKVINDKKATHGEREIASIVMNLNHRPSSQDKSRLKKLMH